MFLLNYVVSNKIGDVGCQSLSKLHLKNLSSLNLSWKCLILDSNSIGDQGCQWLSKVNFPQLIRLLLCIYINIKPTIK